MNSFIYHITLVKGMSLATTIKISKENRERLANFGKAGESLNTALDKVLSMAEQYRKPIEGIANEVPKG